MKLRSLRSELFDPSRSALRYSKYLDLIYEIFGECVLKRPIQLQEDFNPDELSFFKSGAYQLLPFRDRCGRRILACVPSQLSVDKFQEKVLSKIWLYLFFVCIGGSDISNNDKNNLETQQKGIVIVNFPTPYGNDLKGLRKRLLTVRRSLQSIPVQTVALHFCVPNSHIFRFLNSVNGTTSGPSTSRVRFHLGNPIGIHYKLKQFGIPTEHFPASDTGNIKLIYFRQWIKLRTNLEYEEEKKINNNSNANANTNSNIIIVECPLSNDVIFRRGKTMNVHSGNVKFQSLIELHIYEHSISPNSSLLQRKLIEIEILNEISNSGGRFLTWNTDKKCWSVIHSKDEMQFKIHHAFLGFRTRMLKKKQKQQKVLPTTAKLTSLFEGQQVGQKKKRYNNNNCSSSFSDCGLHCDTDDNNSNNSGNNNCSDCGHFFSVDNGSYACTDLS